CLVAAERAVGEIELAGDDVNGAALGSAAAAATQRDIVGQRAAADRQRAALRIDGTAETVAAAFSPIAGENHIGEAQAGAAIVDAAPLRRLTIDDGEAGHRHVAQANEEYSTRVAAADRDLVRAGADPIHGADNV